ncbi:hypothetical protein [Haloarchaeobius salinus]|uniref:hypothetical protein n=1 Tax=Haloarchaeobius salinus TaxID=1198298 RepID=UPI00210D65CE|nr:hypothetical protein [Haloarchaeobius salinus]
MAPDKANDDEQTGGVSRRETLRFLGTAAVSAATLGAVSSAASAAPNGEFGTVVDLGTEGLSSGDEIDPYIDEHFVSGNEVHIPPGEYEWNGTLSGPSDGDAALVGDGEIGDVVFNVNDTLGGEFAHSSGTVMFRNVTFSGANPEPKAGITFAVGDGGTLRFEHIRAPDGASQEEDRFLYADSEHAGVAFVRNCYWQGFGNNGAYTDNGRVVYENCVSHNNNIAGIRMGFGDGEVYNSLIIVDGEIPTDGANSANARGIRLREPGDHVLENCDFVYRNVSGAGSPVELRASETTGVLRNCRVLNETGQPVVRNKSDDASWTAENVHISGGGNLEMEGVDEADVTRGDGATPPRTDFEEFLGAPIDAGASEPSSGTEEPTSTPDDYENNVVLHASPDNDDDVPELSLTVSGDADYGSEAEADTDRITANDDGTTTMTSVGLDPDALDSFLFDGDVVDYSLPDGYVVDVSLNGTVTTFAELVGEEPTKEEEETDQSSDTDEEHELRVHASPDNPNDVQELSVTVSGDAEYGPESETDTDRIVENDDGTTTVVSVGLDPDAVDSYIFTGEAVDYEFPSEYDVSVAIDGESTTFEALVGGTAGDGDSDDSSSDGSSNDGSTDDGSSGDGSTDDGSSDGGSTDDGSSDDGSTDDGSSDGGTTDDGSSDDGSTDDGGSSNDDSKDDGSTDDGSSDEEELPNELVINSTDADSVTAYTVTVSGDVVKDNADSSEGGLFDRFEDVARDGKVIGLVHDGTDVYRYSGSVVEVTIDGNADITLQGV